MLKALGIVLLVIIALLLWTCVKDDESPRSARRAALVLYALEAIYIVATLKAMW
jgi:hypothetical protein